jgi:hypothetical protein
MKNPRRVRGFLEVSVTTVCRAPHFFFFLAGFFFAAAFFFAMIITPFHVRDAGEKNSFSSL